MKVLTNKKLQTTGVMGLVPTWWSTILV